jgi:serine/threonine protein kinase
MQDPNRLATEAGDCWAFGLSLYAMLHGKGAVEDVDGAHASKRLEGILKARELIVSKLNPDNRADRIIFRLLSLKPEERPLMKDVFLELQNCIQQLDNDRSVYAALQNNNVPHVTDVKPWLLEKNAPLTSANFREMIQRETLTPAVFQTRIKYMRQIAQGLSKMHELGYIHNNLSTQVMMYKGGTKEAFLSDFRYAKKKDETIPSEVSCPTPEKVSGAALSPEKVECWRFGLALFEMLHGAEAQKLTATIMQSKNANEFRSAYDAIFSKLDADKPHDSLIRDLLALDPAKRPSMAKVDAILGHLDTSMDMNV